MTVVGTASVLATASRNVAEAERRRDQQISLINGSCGVEQALARQVLVEIERTLTIARVHQSLLQSLIADDK